MYLAMNHFWVKAEDAAAFEGIWRDRDSKLHEFDGFVSFDLLKGAMDEEGFVHYASHALWADKDAFDGWRNSQQFKSSHQAPKPKVAYKGPPKFMGFETLDGLSLKG